MLTVQTVLQCTTFNKILSFSNLKYINHKTSPKFSFIRTFLLIRIILTLNLFCFVSVICVGQQKGIGIGLVTNLLPAIISQYFDKERAIACGISYAGSTLGAFIFPLFIEWLLTIYGLSGTLLLMGGI